MNLKEPYKTKDGFIEVIEADSEGRVFLLDGTDGAVIHSYMLGATLEASPAMFDDTFVISTRDSKIHAFRVLPKEEKKEETVEPQKRGKCHFS